MSRPNYDSLSLLFPCTFFRHIRPSEHSMSRNKPECLEANGEQYDPDTARRVQGKKRDETRESTARTAHLIPGTDDPAEEHEEVTHDDQAGPDHQGEDTKELLEDGLHADQNEHGQEDGHRRGNRDDKGHVVLDVLEWTKIGRVK